MDDDVKVPEQGDVTVEVPALASEADVLRDVLARVADGERLVVFRRDGVLHVENQGR